MKIQEHFEHLLRLLEKCQQKELAEEALMECKQHEVHYSMRHSAVPRDHHLPFLENKFYIHDNIDDKLPGFRSLFERLWKCDDKEFFIQTLKGKTSSYICYLNADATDVIGLFRNQNGFDKFEPIGEKLIEEIMRSPGFNPPDPIPVFFKGQLRAMKTAW